jgi:hypothetical protein
VACRNRRNDGLPVWLAINPGPYLAGELVQPRAEGKLSLACCPRLKFASSSAGFGYPAPQSALRSGGRRRSPRLTSTPASRGDGRERRRGGTEKGEAPRTTAVAPIAAPTTGARANTHRIIVDCWEPLANMIDV